MILDRLAAWVGRRLRIVWWDFVSILSPEALHQARRDHQPGA